MASVIEKTIRSAFTPVIGAVANFNRKRMTAPEGGHPYLTGIHKPMTEELFRILLFRRCKIRT